MHQSRCLVLISAVLIGLFSATSGREIKIQHRESRHRDGNYAFNHTLAEMLVQYSSAVYTSDLSALFTWTCARCGDKIKDFEMVEVIVDIDNCLQKLDNGIRNWIEDLFWKQLDLDYPGMPGAMVHHGFYTAYQSTVLRPAILSALQNIKNIYGNISIIVTGHSMGGALASFCALDLAVNCGEKDVQLMTFGQPRIGNAVFATCFNERIPKAIRLTHQNDIVPHMPPYYSYFPTKTYHHFSREVWLHKEGIGKDELVEKICDDSGEDPTCSRSVYGNSISDHLEYYGFELWADADSTCKIVVIEVIEEYNIGTGGNIRLSRSPNPTLFLKS
ncbi:lipase-like protein [Carex littledalei]|uniref:Lipase-like protein n=1 Tax=Carex littledalei TaxID=544730 RepID=A0A833R0U5_9POAL|nr:lipase-like protein [Carex littledalei]